MSFDPQMLRDSRWYPISVPEAQQWDRCNYWEERVIKRSNQPLTQRSSLLTHSMDHKSPFKKKVHSLFYI